MCGISVILNGTDSPDPVPRILAMHAMIPHRGPDGEGFLAIGVDHSVERSNIGDQLNRIARPRIAMAFRRLKICDLGEVAAQPMESSHGKLWLVFNGEVYNYRELRRELAADGRIFRTQGDTEVVLAAYEKWGEHCFARFEGMWALVIVDIARNQLVVSRDRFGIKPLYWMVDNRGTVLFGSEIKQLLSANQDQTPRANRPLIEMFLRGQRYPVLEETFFDGINAVPPATWAAIALDHPEQPRFNSYWDLKSFTASENRLSYEDAQAKAEQLLASAVDSHRHADVPVAALLSGGLDSSTLVGLAHRAGGPKLPTFSLGYRDVAPNYCEMRYVDVMTRRDSLENHETTMDAAWVATNTDRVLWALEEPPLAMPAFAQFRIFETCAQHGAVAILDGQGADEVTAGYPYHQRAFLQDGLRHGRFMAMARELQAIGRREKRSPARVLAGHFIRPLLQRTGDMPWIAPSDARANADEFTHCRSDYGHDRSLVNRQLYFDVRWGNVKIVLGYGDRNAMAHSVEARVPYFDRAFVEFMFSLPDTYKIGNGYRKRLLRDVARRYVPSEITERADRMGFGTPDEQMIRGPLRDVIAAALHDPRLCRSGWVAAPEVSRFLREFGNRTHNDYRGVWRLFMLSRWATRFGVTG